MMETNYIKREKIEIGAESSGPASLLIAETFFRSDALNCNKGVYNIGGNLSC